MNKIELLKKSIKEKLDNSLKEQKKVIGKSETQADKLMFFIGLTIILIYTILRILDLISKNEPLTEFIIVVGITFCANSFYSWYKRQQISKNDEIICDNLNQQIEDEFERTEYYFKWLNEIDDKGNITAIIDSGLVNVYKDWNEIYEKMKKSLKEKRESICEIICYDGLKDFRSSFDVNIMCEDYFSKGLQLKILSANPNVAHWTQHEIDMYIKFDAKKEFDVSQPPDEYRKQIIGLKNWYDMILKKQAKSNIKLKYHSSLPSISLIRLNNRLYISGKLIGGDTDISRPPIFEYKITNNGDKEKSLFYQYRTYFNCLWNDPDLTTDEQEILINPQLLINNKVINLILKNTCNAMTEILRAACPLEYKENRYYPLKTREANPIRAFFTVLDYAEPFEISAERKITRRFNTNRVNRIDGDIGINNCNGNNDLEGKGYPLSASHAIGYVMINGEGFYKTTDPKKEPQDLDYQSFASLVLPLKSKKTTYIDFVHEGSITREHINIPDTREFNGKKEDNYCNKLTNVFAALTFEFDNNVKHIIVPDQTGYNEDIIDCISKNGFISKFEDYIFNTKQVSWRLIQEAERCQKLLLEYLGFNSGSVNDANKLMNGRLD